MQRQVQQTQAQQAADRDIDPFLADLLGMVEARTQAAPQQRPAPPPRQQRVQQTPGRVASAKAFGNTR